MTQLVVDGANVVGSRPDGWWRDREGAARRLAVELVAALPRLDAEFGPGLHVHLVLEGRAARATDLPEHPALTVVLAPADGDATIAELATALPGDVTVVTADRALRAAVTAAGATTIGPGALLAVVAR